MVKAQFLAKPNTWITTVFLVSAALVTGVVTTYSVMQYGSNNQTDPAPISVSETSTPIEAVAALGYLEPKDEVVKISAPAFVEGARVQELLVKQGYQVKSKQMIAILDNRDRLLAALAQAEAEVAIAQSRITQVKAGAKQGEIIAQKARFRRSQAELEGQITTQQATIASLKAQLEGEMAAEDASIERIKAELNNAQTDCQRYETLYQNGAVAAQERDTFCLQAETTQKNLQQAQANLKRIHTTLDAKIQEAKANLSRTRLTLDEEIIENQASLNAVSEIRLVDVQFAQAELLSAQAAVKKAKAELDLAYVRAPKDGQILKIHAWPGEVVDEAGIVDLGQTSQMYVVAQVYETDISRVRVGQVAKIHSDGVTANLEGVVDNIGLQIGRKDVLGTDPVADADARVVEVKIRLNPQSSQQVTHLTNLQVNVIIVTSSQETGVRSQESGVRKK